MEPVNRPSWTPRKVAMEASARVSSAWTSPAKRFEWPCRRTGLIEVNFRELGNEVHGELAAVPAVHGDGA